MRFLALGVPEELPTDLLAGLNTLPERVIPEQPAEKTAPAPAGRNIEEQPTSLGQLIMEGQVKARGSLGWRHRLVGHVRVYTRMGAQPVVNGVGCDDPIILERGRENITNTSSILG